MKRRALATAGLLLASLVFAALLGEGILRLRGVLRGERLGPCDSIPAEWSDLPRLENLFEFMQPNVRGLVACVFFETNSFGFRGAEVPVEKPPDHFRIVLFGDSLAMGFGVLGEDTYAARLEERLNGERDDLRYQVLNVGLAGLNAQQAVQRFKSVGLQFEPDMVVYGFTVNDIEGPSYRKSRSDFMLHARRFADSPLHLVRFLGPRWMSLQALRGQEGSYVLELRENYFQNPEAWRYLLTALEEAAQIAQQRGACAVLLVHTQLHFLGGRHPFTSIYDAVAGAARSQGWHVIPTFGWFRGKPARSLWVHDMDPHPNADGHRILAEALWDGLGELPARCWDRQASPR